MCFTGNVFSKKKIAKEDILCYKCGDIVDGDYPQFHPIFYNDYFYLKDYFQPRLLLKKEISYLFWFSIHTGYHSYKHFKNELSWMRVNVEKFIIPKGSTYYENKNEYVSDLIKWIGH